jgi:hypothetical protein
MVMWRFIHRNENSVKWIALLFYVLHVGLLVCSHIRWKPILQVVVAGLGETEPVYSVEEIEDHAMMQHVRFMVTVDSSRIK